jgi:ectoine hydroxylase-related dioxygenase (phytanoyl-CoA dioxygenase family)
MFKVLKEKYFNEYYTTGFVDTDIVLPDGLVNEIREHYQKIQEGRNDFPNFFVNNEHLAYMEGNEIGDLFTESPDIAKKMVKNLYDQSYTKAVYREQVFIKKVCQYLLANGFQTFFKTRYLLAGYDMYLRSKYGQSEAGIHTDLPNFHHFYETENDLSIYIPLIDLDENNGGRITVLPESQLKLPGNLFVKLLEQHFSKHSDYLDEQGYINPEQIPVDAINDFIKSKSYQQLFTCYRNLTELAKTHYQDDFNSLEETMGKALLWNNKNFHAAENWKNKTRDREVYVIRLFPIYDTKIRLKSTLHGRLFNNFLIDTETAEIQCFNKSVDVTLISKQDKIAL